MGTVKDGQFVPYEPSPKVDPRTEQLRRGLDATRAEMSETVAALEHRLNPETLRERTIAEIHTVEERLKGAVKEQIATARGAIKEELVAAKHDLREEVETAFQNAKQAMRDATVGRVEVMANQAGDIMINARDTFVETVRNNPIPAVMAGLGIAWLLINRNSPTRAGEIVTNTMGEIKDQVTHTASDAIRTAKDKAGQLVNQTSRMTDQLIGSAKDTTAHLRDQAYGIAHQVRDEAKMGIQRVEGVFEDGLRERPLMLSLLFLGVGLAVGFTLPRTRREDELFGGVRGQLMQKAQDATTDVFHAVQQYGNKGAQEVKKGFNDIVHS